MISICNQGVKSLKLNALRFVKYNGERIGIWLGTKCQSLLWACLHWVCQSKNWAQDFL